MERLRVLHDFYRTGEEAEYRLVLHDLMQKGHSFKDTICPDSLEFKKDHFVMGSKFGRVLFLKEYASYIKDSMISELTVLNRTMMLSIDVIPVPTDEAVRQMQNRLLGVETNVTNWQRRQNNNNNCNRILILVMWQGVRIALPGFRQVKDQKAANPCGAMDSATSFLPRIDIMKKPRFSSCFIEKWGSFFCPIHCCIRGSCILSYGLSLRKPPKRKTNLFTQGRYLNTAFQQTLPVNVLKHPRRFIIKLNYDMKLTISAFV